MPVRFNDGRGVPDQWIGEAAKEIADYFGASSYETQRIQGLWRQSGELVQDDLVRLFVDVTDTVKTRKWMRQFRERWRRRLEQIEIWMVSYPISVE